MNLGFQRELGCLYRELSLASELGPSMCPFGVCLSVTLLVLCPRLSQREREGSVTALPINFCLPAKEILFSYKFLIFSHKFSVIISNFI